MKIKLLNASPKFKKGSSRAKWFTAIKRYDGKDVEEFVESHDKEAARAHEIR